MEEFVHVVCDETNFIVQDSSLEDEDTSFQDRDSALEDETKVEELE